MIKISKKSQSLIMQFILFFIIGFTVFITVGNFFKYQSDIFRSDIAYYTLKLTNSYISGNAITMLSCKECDYSSINFSSRLDTRPDYFFEVTFDNKIINTSFAFTSLHDISSIHNMNESDITFTGKSSVSKPLTLTLNKTKKELRVD